MHYSAQLRNWRSISDRPQETCTVIARVAAVDAPISRCEPADGKRRRRTLYETRHDMNRDRSKEPSRRQGKLLRGSQRTKDSAR
jgi:hypothetical protein